MSIRTLLGWGEVWLVIAQAHLDIAESARARYGTTGDSAADSKELTAEFHASLVAVAASSFAIEAACNDLPPAQINPSTPADRALNRGDWIGCALKEQGVIGDETVSALGDLFHRRNQSVHPKDEWRDVLLPHGTGTYTALELVEFSLEPAHRAVATAQAVIAALATGT